MSRQDDIADLVQDLLDTAIEHMHDRASEETFHECQMCGDVDSHTDTCPIPWLQKWQDAPILKGFK